MSKSAGLEVANTTLLQPFSNAKDWDLVLYTSQSNQPILIGCGIDATKPAMVVVSDSNVTFNKDVSVEGKVTGKLNVTDLDFTGSLTVNGRVFAEGSLSNTLQTVASSLPANGYGANTITVPTVSTYAVPTSANIVYSRVVLGAHNGTSLTANANITIKIAHNIGDSNYLVFPSPEDSSIIQVKCFNFTNNTFDMNIKNISTGSIASPAINYQIVKAATSLTVNTLASPVSISRSSEALSTFSGATSTSKSYTLSNASDPAGYPITYSIVSDTTNKFAINADLLTYNHARVTGSGTVVIKAVNPYVDDTSKIVTITMNETKINSPLLGTSTLSTTQKSSGSGTAASSNLATADQGLSINWSLGTNSLGATLVGNLLSWTSAGSVQTRSVIINAAFLSNIMAEAALATTSITLSVTEEYIQPIVLTALSASIKTSAKNQSKTLALASTANSRNLTWSYVSGGDFGIAPSVSNNTLTYYSQGSSVGFTITLQAVYTSVTMADYGLAIPSITFTVTEDYIQPLSLSNLTATIYTSSRNASKTRSLSSTANSRNLTWSYVSGGDFGTVPYVSGTTLTYYSQGSSVGFTITLRAVYTSVTMADYGLSAQTVTFTVTEDYIPPVSVAGQSTSISSTGSGQQFSHAMPLTSNGRSLVYSNNSAASVSGNTVYFNSQGSPTSFTVSVNASYDSSTMTLYGLSSVLVSLTVSETYTAPATIKLNIENANLIVESYSWNLNNYFYNATSYGITSNPNNNASISGSTLTITYGCRNTTYNIGLRAYGAGGNADQTLNVKEGLCYDPSGTYTYTYYNATPGTNVGSVWVDLDAFKGAGTVGNPSDNTYIRYSAINRFYIEKYNTEGTLTNYSGNKTISWNNGTTWRLY